jgi:formylglycine-generating enzyme required for sulfatase activity
MRSARTSIKHTAAGCLRASTFLIGNSLSESSQRASGTVFRECPECPEMVVIPGGQFSMGSSPAEKTWAIKHGATAEAVSDESPQHLVSLQSFALGKYDVTQGEYSIFVHEPAHSQGDGCGRDGAKWNKQPGVSWLKPGFDQTDRDPVMCVSWQDARAYASWLNGKVHQGSSSDNPYRLPSEAEWEYAARGTTLSWGNDDAAAAQHGWYKDNAEGKTHPVGLKLANPFGLYDMAGNVWQWTQDCYVDSNTKAPKDGRSVETPDGCMRADRGGSWYDPSWPCTRERNPPESRDLIMGLRVARSLP